MLSPSIRQQAQSAHTKQDYAKAERLYRYLLKTEAERDDAINLGALLRTTGRCQEAITHYKEWLDLFPNELTLRLNAINCALEVNATSTSKEWINYGINQYPGNRELRICEAKQYLAEGQYSAAINHLTRLITEDPQNESIWTLLSYSYHLNQQPLEALINIEKALKLIPESTGLTANKISILKELGEWEKAEAFYKHIDPSKRDERINGAYAELKIAQQRPEEAIHILSLLCVTNPSNASHWLNLVASLRGSRKIVSALKMAKKGLSIHPNHRKLKQATAQCLSEVGKQKQATPLIAEIITKNKISDLSNSEIYSLQFIGSGYHTLDPITLTRVARDWENSVVKSGSGDLWGDRILERRKGRKIRVGYFSADFCNHPVCRFIIPILQSHAKDSYEIIGLSFGIITDEMTSKVRSVCDEWHELNNLPCLDAARFISDLKIDVLIELGGYTANSRVDVLCHKPVKKQLSYLGYFAPTYLKCIDGWIGDEVLFAGLSEGSSGCTHHHINGAIMA